MIDPVFNQLLKMQRQSMTATARKASYNKKLPVWIHPYQYEREYARGIAEILQPLYTAVQEQYTPEVLAGFTKEARGDTRQDSEIVYTTDESITHPFGILWSEDLPHKDAFDENTRQDGFAADLIVIAKRLRDVVNILFIDNPEPTRALVSGIGFSVNDFNQKQWSKILNKLVGINYIKTEPWEIETVNMWGDENFNLIKNLADEVIKKINTGISQGVMGGKTAKEMEAEIQKLLKTHIGNYRNPGYRARLIARDQVGKLNGYMTKRRQTDVGIDKYIWSTSEDERVRTDHKAMDGALCRWDDATVMSRDGGKTWIKRPVSMQGAIPGSQINCRCSSIPDMTDIYGDIDND